MLIEAMKQALKALDCIYSPLHVREIEKVGKAMGALRTAIEEAEKSNIKQVIELYDEPPAAQPAVPEGWKLVPVKPTKAMAAAYWKFNNRQDVRMVDAWMAMLAAAPTQGEPK